MRRCPVTRTAGAVPDRREPSRRSPTRRLSMPTPVEYAQAHRSQFEQELSDLLRIPSIGTLPAHRDDTQHAAHWVAEPPQGDRDDRRGHPRRAAPARVRRVDGRTRSAHRARVRSLRRAARRSARPVDDPAVRADRAQRRPLRPRRRGRQGPAVHAGGGGPRLSEDGDEASREREADHRGGGRVRRRGDRGLRAVERRPPAGGRGARPGLRVCTPLGFPRSRSGSEGSSAERSRSSAPRATSTRAATAASRQTRSWPWPRSSPA